MGLRSRAIVTGGAGFVGSHLVDRLIAEGDAVLVIDDLSTGSAGNVSPSARLEVLDIAGSDLGPLFADWRPNVVYHLAAQASVPYRWRIHAEIWPSTSKAHFASPRRRGRSGPTRLVFVSSGGAIYGETSRPATEQTLPAPMSYYGIHKLAAEGYVGRVWRQSRGRSSVEHLWSSAGRGTRGCGRRVVPGAGHRDGADPDPRRRVADARLRPCVRRRRRAPSARDDGWTDPGTWNVASGRSISVVELASIVEAGSRAPTGAESTVRAGPVTSPILTSRRSRLRALGWRPVDGPRGRDRGVAARRSALGRRLIGRCWGATNPPSHRRSPDAKIGG